MPPCDSGSLSGAGDVITREAEGNHIDPFEAVRSNISHVSKPGNIGPVFGEDAPRVVVDFNLPPYLEAGTGKTEVDAADTGEERADGEGHATTPTPNLYCTPSPLRPTLATRCASSAASSKNTLTHTPSALSARAHHEQTPLCVW